MSKVQRTNRQGFLCHAGTKGKAAVDAKAIRVPYVGAGLRKAFQSLKPICHHKHQGC